MTVNEYQKEAIRTLSTDQVVHFGPDDPLLNEGLMGLSSEAGEALDVLKKAKFQGHILNTQHLIEELGDVAWYLAVSAYSLGCTLEEVLQKNVEKRHARYPDGFDAGRSIDREEGDV